MFSKTNKPNIWPLWFFKCYNHQQKVTSRLKGISVVLKNQEAQIFLWDSFVGLLEVNKFWLVKYVFLLIRYSGVAGVENLSCVNASSHLIASSNRKRRYSTDEPASVSTQPSKWPGKISVYIHFSNYFNWPHNEILIIE